MSLNEQEQKILNESEQQLYEEVPRLAQKVAKAVRTGQDRWRMRLAAVVFVFGAVVMFASFTRTWIVAGLGFLIMVASAGWMAHAVGSLREARGGSGVLDSLMERLGRRWQQGD